MKRRRVSWRVSRWGSLLPLLIAYQQLGCLPDGAVRQVFGENIVLTSAITIQGITALIFNSLFSLLTMP